MVVEELLKFLVDKVDGDLADVVSVGLEQLVENMVGPLNLLFLSDTGLLEQVGHDVTTAKLSACSEVDSDELSKPE